MLQNGFHALQSGNLTQAEQISRVLVAQNPRDEGALLLLAMSLDAQTRLDEAATVFTQPTTLYPQRAEHWLNLGYLERSRSNVEARTPSARGARSRSIRSRPMRCVSSDSSKQRRG